MVSQRWTRCRLPRNPPCACRSTGHTVSIRTSTLHIYIYFYIPSFPICSHAPLPGYMQSIPAHPSSSSSQPTLITSLSTGSLAHLIPRPPGWEVSQSFHAHDYEPWITSFDLGRPEVVWSGGDDCKLKCWDLRDTSRPVVVNKR
jgi:hypothetical protein